MPTEPTPVEPNEDPLESALGARAPPPGGRTIRPPCPTQAGASRHRAGARTRWEHDRRIVPTKSNRTGESRGQQSSNPPEPDSAAKPENWPSAKDILATHRNRPRPLTTPVLAGRKAQQEMRRHWPASPPDGRCRAGSRARRPWCLSWPSASRRILSWLWAADSYSASIMTARLLAANRPRPTRAAPGIGRAARRHLDSLDRATPGTLGDLHELRRIRKGTLAAGSQIALE